MPFWATALIIVGLLSAGLGLARIMSRRKRQRQQTVSMLHAMYATHTGQRAMLENMQMNLSIVCESQGIMASESVAGGDEAICLGDQKRRRLEPPLTDMLFRLSNYLAWRRAT
jgi:hypothetical protein